MKDGIVRTATDIGVTRFRARIRNQLLGTAIQAYWSRSKTSQYAKNAGKKDNPGELLPATGTF